MYKSFFGFESKKSVPELTFAKLTFDKSDLLDLVKFITVDRFLILPPIPPLPIPAILLDISSFFLFSVA